MSTKMPRSLAMLWDLAAALQKAEEDYLEEFNLMAGVARVAIWDGNITASGTYLHDGTV